MRISMSESGHGAQQSLALSRPIPRRCGVRVMLASLQWIVALMAKVFPDGWRELEATGAAQREIETLGRLCRRPARRLHHLPFGALDLSGNKVSQFMAMSISPW